MIVFIINSSLSHLKNLNTALYLTKRIVGSPVACLKKFFSTQIKLIFSDHGMLS